MHLLVAFIALGLSKYVSAHTYVWSVWVNGVDQGSGVAIREPAYNGPPPKGYANSPVRDLNSIDLRCNVLGDVPDPHTVQVKPDDILTFEWHHNNRTAADDIIDLSHKGAGNIYISPNPPSDNSFVKIQEEGEFADGTWYVAGKLNQRAGKQDVRIPHDLAPGQYLLRSELLALHEADVSHAANPNRGIQIYISCVQIEVTGTGSTQLPEGVSFPGAYSYSDPGIVHNIYLPNASFYQIPGPAVWSGAAPSPDPPVYEATLGMGGGYTTAPQWSTWIGNGFSTATLQTSLTIVTGASTLVQTYVAHWPTPAPTVPPSPVPTPTPSGATVVKYGQCGGLT
ncbi:hypothetical protein NLI96_g11037 [Meripilus lineatus]|uniref:AA9 family lytic polysaccharide monooxygenase n=1 Tax=Meripilus lineatus TaxID=2056292 RepID=A0AAD5YDS1_9APHY|nr:hypothetical protein NLI96_g11037 [Physisporinus lineatus]